MGTAYVTATDNATEWRSKSVTENVTPEGNAAYPQVSAVVRRSCWLISFACAIPAENAQCLGSLRLTDEVPNMSWEFNFTGNSVLSAWRRPSSNKKGNSSMADMVPCPCGMCGWQTSIEHAEEV